MSMQTKGFTLIEVLVSTAIFSVVVIIALGALLAMSESDRKAQTLKAVINNLNFSLDAMSRAVRTGEDYACITADNVDPHACDQSPSSSFFFTDSNGKKVVYCLSNGSTNTCTSAAPGDTNCTALDASGNPDPCSVLRSYDGGPYVSLTSPEVKVTNLAFFLSGAERDETPKLQPKVAILLSGFVRVAGGAKTLADCSVSGNQCSTFSLQTSVTQRIYDQ